MWIYLKYCIRLNIYFSFNIQFCLHLSWFSEAILQINQNYIIKKCKHRVKYQSLHHYISYFNSFLHRLHLCIIQNISYLLTYICTYTNIWEKIDYVQTCSACGFLNNLTICFAFSHVSSFKSVPFFSGWMLISRPMPSTMTSTSHLGSIST